MILIVIGGVFKFIPKFSVYMPKDESFKKISEKNSNVVIYNFARDAINNESVIADLSGKSALYFLFNEELEDRKYNLYIGETEDILARVNSHNKDDSKDFSDVICVINEKESFTKTETLYLEKATIEMAKKILSNTVSNGNNGRDTTISREDKEGLDDLISEMKQMLSIFGYGHLVENKVAKILESSEGGGTTPETENDAKHRIFYLYSAKKEGEKELAKAVYKDGKMTLLKGAKITKEPKDSFKKESTFKKYKSYIEDTSLVKEEDNFFVLQQDLEFTSVSYPSDIVKGYSTNGWFEWKNIDGKTMDKLFRQ